MRRNGAMPKALPNRRASWSKPRGSSDAAAARSVNAGRPSRRDLDHERAERLGVVAAAIDRQLRVSHEADGVADDLGAAGAGCGAAREIDRAGRNVDRARQVLRRAAVEFEDGAERNAAIAEYDD